MGGPSFIRVLLAVPLALVTLSACGGDGPQGVERVLAGIRAAYVAQDYAAVCDELTARAREQVGSIGHEPPTTCRRDLATRMPFEEIVSRADLEPPAVRKVRFAGDQAVADVIVGNGTPMTLRFRRRDGRWRLDTLFGTVATKVPRPRARPARGARSLRVGLRVRDRRVRGCSPVVIRGLVAKGGCQLMISGTMTLMISTVFGDRLYARCLLRLFPLVDAHGAVALGYFEVQSRRGSGNDTCGDIYACHDANGESQPTPGRLVSTGTRLELRLADLCLDTCLGRFAGPVAFPLTPSRQGFRIEAGLAPIGSTGMAISGSWAVGSQDFDTRVAVIEEAVAPS